MMSRLSILVGLLAVECVIFVFFCVKAIGFAEQYSTESAHHQALIVAESLAPVAAEALVSGEHNSFHSVIDKFYSNSEIAAFSVLDKSSTAVINSTVNGNLNNLHREADFAAFTVQYPLIYNDVLIGSLSLQVSSKSLQATSASVEKSLILIGLLLFFFTVIGFVLLSRIFPASGKRDVPQQFHAQSPETEKSREVSRILRLEKMNYALVNYSPEAIVIVDRENNVVEFNSAAEELFTIGRQAVLCRKLDELFSIINNKTVSSLEALINNLESGCKNRQLFLKLPDATCVDVAVDVALFDDLSASRHAILYFKKHNSAVSEDVIKQYVAKLDDLTHLPARDVLVGHLVNTMQYAKQANRQVIVMKLGLDRFKNINDSLGHHMGNELLKNVARRLSSMMRRGDIVSRVNGDQFVVVLADVSELTNPDSLIKRYIDSFAEPFVVDGHQLHVNVSIGVSMFPGDHSDAEILLRNAESAMFRAKLTSGSSYEFYSDEMRHRSKERLFLENELRLALKHKQFELHYQPQVDLASGNIVGIEALIRWNHPTLGQIPPGRFIPLAEETGIILEIGEWVLQKACEQNMELMQETGERLMLAINLSARQFVNNNLVNSVAEVLNHTAHPAELLELEITESLLMDNIDSVAEVLSIFSDQGIKISMDDFGTGYSSLSYLKKFPINTLKVDRMFVRDILQDADNASIVRATIKMAHSLNIDIVAEGVETKEQLAFLRRHRCDKIQGFLISKPLTFDDLKSVLNENFCEDSSNFYNISALGF